MELVCAVSGKPQPTVYWTKGTDRIEPNKGTGLSGRHWNSRFRFNPDGSSGTDHSTVRILRGMSVEPWKARIWSFTMLIYQIRVIIYVMLWTRLVKIWSLSPLMFKLLLQLSPKIKPIQLLKANHSRSVFIKIQLSDWSILAILPCRGRSRTWHPMGKRWSTSDQWKLPKCYFCKRLSTAIWCQ